MHRVHPIKTFYDNYVWVVSHPSKPHCVIVDPGQADPILTYLEQQQQSLQGILVTHHHSDHIDGIAKIIQHHPVRVYGNKADTISPISHPVKPGTTLNIDPVELQFEVIPCPGHTLTHISYYAAADAHNPPRLFCGDTLFGAGCGRMFEGHSANLYNTIQKIMALPDDTLIYCAHEYTLRNLAFASTIEPDNPDIIKRTTECYKQQADNTPSIPSTLALEKKTNPFMRTDCKQVRKAAEQQWDHPCRTPIEVFAALRAWKDIF